MTNSVQHVITEGDVKQEILEIELLIWTTATRPADQRVREAQRTVRAKRMNLVCFEIAERLSTHGADWVLAGCLEFGK